MNTHKAIVLILHTCGTQVPSGHAASKLLPDDVILTPCQFFHGAIKSWDTGKRGKTIF